MSAWLDRFSFDVLDASEEREMCEHVVEKSLDLVRFAFDVDFDRRALA